VCVTQIIGDAADFDEACPAPTTPEEPEVPEVEVEGKQQVAQPDAVPASLPVEPAVKGVQAGSLPVTGSDSLPLQALFGLALTGGGILIQRRTKRVRTDRTIE
jgi:LPXTG-motif cell wall-anchored protein